MSNCVIKNSVCSKEAGGIYFSNNNLKSGYVYLPKDIRMINVTLINNTVLSVGSSNNNGGGGVQVKECTNAYLLNVTFINNTARIGGGLYFYNRGNSDPIKIIKNIIFINNTATEGGGAIYVQYKSTITDNVFIGNKALNSASGGAIYINANPVTISKNNFTILFASLQKMTKWGGLVLAWVM